MEKKIGKMTKTVITDAAKQALNDGNGARAIGSSNGVTVGNTYTILGVDYRTQLFPPRGMSDEEWQEKSEQEKKDIGRPTGWFTFLTNNGDLSFSAVLGAVEMYSEEFWTPSEGQTDEQAGISRAEDFDLSKIFKPSARTPEAFIANDCDGLIGKTVRVVATKEYQRGIFDAKARAMVIE